jgi:hypothetical protein
VTCGGRCAATGKLQKNALRKQFEGYRLPTDPASNSDGGSSGGGGSAIKAKL